LADPADLASRSGLEFLQAMLSGDLPAPRIGETLDFHPVEFGQGRAVFEGLPDERHYNPIGGVHGGYVATLLDSCMGCAVHTLLEVGIGYTTLEIKVAFLRPLTKTTGAVRAVGTAVNRGRHVAYAEGRLIDGSDRLLAQRELS